MRSLSSLDSTAVAPTSAATSTARSPWHSPVSYLFGGLAAMTGLIAFALLILACSYCHFARADDDDSRRRQGDVEQGKTGEGEMNKVSPAFEEKFLVIMAGNEIPTFLATPRFSKASLLAPPENDGGDGTVATVAGDGGHREENPNEEIETENLNGHDQKSMAESSTQRDRAN